MEHIDLSRYFVEKGCKTGRPRYDERKPLKVILFAFMEKGVCSLREIEKRYRNDIRYMYEPLAVKWTGEYPKVRVNLQTDVR